MLAVQQEKKKWFHPDTWPDRRKGPKGKAVRHSVSVHTTYKAPMRESNAAQDCLELSLLIAVNSFLEGDFETLKDAYEGFSADISRMTIRNYDKRRELLGSLWLYLQDPPDEHVAVVDSSKIDIFRQERKRKKALLEEAKRPTGRAPKRRIWHVNKPLRRLEVVENVILLPPPPAPRLELARSNVDAHAAAAVSKVVPGLLDAVGRATAEAVSTSGRNAGYVHERAIESLIHSLAASIGKVAHLSDLNDQPEHPQLIEMQTAVA